MFSCPIIKVYYFYSVWQKSFETEDIKKIEFIKDIPNQESIEKISNNLHNLIIIDDLQTSALNSEFIANLFSRESHHRNISVFLILQNLFHQGKYSCDISLNSHYFILFKNIRDYNQIKYLGNQMGIGKKLTEAYLDATAEPFSYLLIDLSPLSDSSYMLRSNILPDEYVTVYK